MANHDLEKIKRNLKRADFYQRDAEKTAEGAGDKEGAEKIKEARKANKKALESFPGGDNKEDF